MKSGNAILEQAIMGETPFYFYDLELLEGTLDALKSALAPHPSFKVHFAMKANCNPRILRTISQAGLGADCVSGGEVRCAMEAGFPVEKIVLAGVGKTDKEIVEALRDGIFCLNVESEPEIEVISQLALKHGFKARIALRVNPGIDAHTHKYITTGTDEDKFGIPQSRLPEALQLVRNLHALQLVGLHFHIGSQLTDLTPYRLLCEHVNQLQDEMEARGEKFEFINLGGGLGVDYDDPEGNPIPDFKSFFNLFASNLRMREGQEIHFELGRSIVAQCGTLVSRVIFVKDGIDRQFMILDAGFNNLIRPALYQAYHKIENLTADADAPLKPYDVVGPICESTDTFAKGRLLPETKRGDIIAIRTAGAYGETMSSRYNMRDFAPVYFNK